MSDELVFETELAKAILIGDGRINSCYDMTFQDYNFEASKQNYEAWRDKILKEAKPFHVRKIIQQLYDMRINELKEKYHFETQGWDNNLRCITFTRTVERGEIHEVILEDHSDDEPTNDWLIFSYLKDIITNWDGWKEDEQYPLERGEYRLFDRLISSIEQLYPLENSKPPIVSETK